MRSPITAKSRRWNGLLGVRFENDQFEAYLRFPVLCIPIDGGDFDRELTRPVEEHGVSVLGQLFVHLSGHQFDCRANRLAGTVEHAEGDVDLAFLAVEFELSNAEREDGALRAEPVARRTQANDAEIGGNDLDRIENDLLLAGD